MRGSLSRCEILPSVNMGWSLDLDVAAREMALHACIWCQPARAQSRGPAASPSIFRKLTRAPRASRITAGAGCSEACTAPARAPVALSSSCSCPFFSVWRRDLPPLATTGRGRGPLHSWSRASIACCWGGCWWRVNVDRQHDRHKAHRHTWSVLNYC
jgi:hypothetical protein